MQAEAPLRPGPGGGLQALRAAAAAAFAGPLRGRPFDLTDSDAVIGDDAAFASLRPGAGPPTRRAAPAVRRAGAPHF